MLSGANTLEISEIQEDRNASRSYQSDPEYYIVTLHRKLATVSIRQRQASKPLARRTESRRAVHMDSGPAGKGQERVAHHCCRGSGRAPAKRPGPAFSTEELTANFRRAGCKRTADVR